MILLWNTPVCTVEVGTPAVRVPLPYRSAYFVSSAPRTTTTTSLMASAHGT